MNMKLHNPTLRVIEVIETVAENQSGLISNIKQNKLSKKHINANFKNIM